MALGNWRWQIMPAYALAVVMLIAAYWRSRSSDPPRHRTWGRVLGAAAGALLLCVLLVGVLAPPLIFPMFEAPAPSGSYGVGIVDIHPVDMARAETMTEDPGDRRELVVRAWYPASIPRGARPEPFLREIEPLHHVFARGRPYLRPFMLSHLTRIPGHSYLNAPPAEGESRFPVLIFSHGNSL
jgi:predicted dienelactone hydrolase